MYVLYQAKDTLITVLISIIQIPSKHTFLLLFPVALTDWECVGVRVLLWIPTQKFSRFWTTVALERKQNNNYFSITVFQYKILINSPPPLPPAKNIHSVLVLSVYSTSCTEYFSL